VKSGQRVLVQGAAGAVGQALVVLAKLAGLEVWGTARDAQLEVVRTLGATPIDNRHHDPRAVVAGGFDAVFDGIGAHGFSDSWTCVRTGGTLAAFGFSDAVQHGGSLLTLGATMLRLRLWDAFGHAHARFYSVTELRKNHPEWYRADLETLFRLLAKGSIRPRIAERIGLDGVPAAHARVEGGHLDGKIVICP
jgi:NADPH:quinone reductase-like Zn-dependent oxidoreductase